MENLCLQSSELEAGGSVAAGTWRGWGALWEAGERPGQERPGSGGST